MNLSTKKVAVQATFHNCIFKTTYMFVDGQSFFESILTCVPILQRWSLRNYVAQCHLLRKCSGIIMNASPQASLFRSIPAVSCPLPRLFGQALTRLVTVSSMCYHTSTPALSTSSSSRGFTSLKNGISHLEGGFTLRCLQRLSLPVLATRPWLWQANRSTSGPSIPVLSY